MNASFRDYVVGIDVGSRSVGMTAIEIDPLGRPVEILAAVSQMHDAGVLKQKEAETRLAEAGVARRLMKGRRRRRQRLRALDRQLEAWGWEPLPVGDDPYLAQHARKRLATEFIADEAERNTHLATALRHLIRHRGWRNPYQRASALYEPCGPSEAMAELVGHVEALTGRRFGEDATPAEVEAAIIEHDPRLRSKPGRPKHPKKQDDRPEHKPSVRLQQCDYANEIHAYARMQGLPDEDVRRLIDLVFYAETSLGSWTGRVGKDPFDGAPRALTATDAFQRFRLADALANVRVKAADGSVSRLDRVQLTKAFEHVLSLDAGEQPTWGDIAEVLDLPRRSLYGRAAVDSEGAERLPSYPPVHVVDHKIRDSKKAKGLRAAWMVADGDTRDALISCLRDGAIADDTPAAAAALNIVDGLSEDELVAIDGMDLPAGRAAYSTRTLRRLTDHILSTEGADLHSARMDIFNVDAGWVPPPEPVGAPVGNPAADRVFKIVARLLQAAEAQWGAPSRVAIEHVRDGFTSEATSREYDKAARARDAAKKRLRERVEVAKGGGPVREYDIRKYEALARQNGQCLYCGAPISQKTAEIDHIVPRKGPGSTNARTNLAAVCGDCNNAKNNRVFAVWAEHCTKPGVSVAEAVARTKFWNRDAGTSVKRWATFLSEVRDRLERTEEDPEIDSRSMESVAWMARELRARIAGKRAGTNTSAGPKSVYVYRGELTWIARRITGLEGHIPWIGPPGVKTRLDRRHHVVDAAVISLMNESVARTLAEALSMKNAERLQPGNPNRWKKHTGSTPAAREKFATWNEHMHDLGVLLAAHFDEDSVPVTQNLRLRLGNGLAHEETIHPFPEFIELGKPFTYEQFMRLATPSLWKAIAAVTTFDADGNATLDPDRPVRHHGRTLEEGERLPLLPQYSQAPAGTPLAALAVRGGYAELGSTSIHHARIYLDPSGGRDGTPVFRQLRIYTEDLRRHRNEDLFTVEIPPQSISRRTADPAFRADIDHMTYLGWIVRGDELELTNVAAFGGHLARFINQFGPTARWRVTGFESATQLTLAPAQIAAEGLGHRAVAAWIDEDATASVGYVLAHRWRPSVDKLFTLGAPKVIRRDALGRERWTSCAHLPLSWSAPPPEG